MMVSHLPTVVSNQRTHSSLPESLTKQFYDWEKRGRGWQVWDEPVDLEPAFRPFYFHLHTPVPKSIDTGHRETFLSRLGRFFTPDEATFSADTADTFVDPAFYDPMPSPYRQEGPLIELRVTLPPNLSVAKIESEHLLLNLSYCRGPVSYEIIGTANEIVVQFVCQESDRALLVQQLKAHFPDSMAVEQDNSLRELWDAHTMHHTVVVDFGLSHEFVRPINTFRAFDVDPLIGCVGALDRLEPDEAAVYQVLFQPVAAPWGESILHSVTDGLGGSFFVDAPEMVKLARDKIAYPLYAAVVRIAAKSPTRERAWDIARSLGGALTPYSDPASNEFIPLNNEGYPDHVHEHDLLNRQSHRSGMLLNSDELVGLVHLPSASVRAERLDRKVARTKAAPAIMSHGEAVLGQNTHNGKTVEVKLTTDQRIRHTYVVGASGTGKSTFLLNLITQDIQAGRGVGVLDPHGDLIDDVLARIPEHRHKDVILFDPADEDFPIGFNVLSAHSELEKNLIASDMVATFQRLSTSWGDQMTTVLSNAILAFLESGEGGTLADLRRFLVEKEFRWEFLKSVKDRDVQYYWEKEFPLLSGRPQGPILTRLDAFLRPKLVRHMVAQKENRVDFADIMNYGKIFLARLAQGAIGEENAYLLGTLLVSKFHQMTMSRQELQEEDRRPFYLYIDEFHNFITPSMASILTGVRKYRLGLTLAHQELRQLEKRDSEVASAALSNPHTRVCFRVGESDARKLAEGLSYFEPSDLLNLSTGEAICRVERANYDFSLNVTMPERVLQSDAVSLRRRVIEKSRKQYATPRAEVEAFLEAQWQKHPGSMGSENEVDATSISDNKRVGMTQTASKERTDAPPPKQNETSNRHETATQSSPPQRVVHPEPSPLGKGGQEHVYLQNLIKRWAEGMGYRATIEKQLGDGCSVDVALEKGDVSIACEIAVTTTPEHELGNLRKCLDAGFSHVVAVSTEAKKLQGIQNLCATELSGNDLARTRFLPADQLFQFIEEIEAESASLEHTVKGYKVKVKYSTPGDQEKKARKRAVSQVILGALSKAKR